MLAGVDSSDRGMCDRRRPDHRRPLAAAGAKGRDLVGSSSEKEPQRPRHPAIHRRPVEAGMKSHRRRRGDHRRSSLQAIDRIQEFGCESSQSSRSSTPGRRRRQLRRTGSRAEEPLPIEDFRLRRPPPLRKGEQGSAFTAIRRQNNLPNTRPATSGAVAARLRRQSNQHLLTESAYRLPKSCRLREGKLHPIRASAVANRVCEACDVRFRRTTAAKRTNSSRSKSSSGSLECQGLAQTVFRSATVAELI